MSNSPWPPNQLYGFCKCSVIFRQGLHLRLQPHLTRALPPLYLLPTKSHNVLLLQWLPVPDSMLFFNPSQTVKPLASWMPPMSLSSRLLSVVWPIFSLSLLRALPNCLRMDDLSEGPEEIETSVSITRSLWHAQTHPHTYKETQMGTCTQREHVYSGMHPVYI